MFVAHQVGAALAAYGAGLTRTVEGTYAPAFLTSGMLCVVAGLLSLFIGRSALSRDRPTAIPSAAPGKARCRSRCSDGEAADDDHFCSVAVRGKVVSIVPFSATLDYPPLRHIYCGKLRTMRERS